MNNIGLFPFERNNYFKGKRLSASAFESEQKYYNDKRRLMNRFAGGFGVVCGLDTVAVSDDKISVEAGLAVDGCGREIVVDAPQVKRLSALNGYDLNKSSGEYYLYIEYSERLSGEVDLDNADNGAAAYDIVSEGFDLYLADPPQPHRASYYKNTAEIFRSGELAVSITVPKFIKAKDKFPLEVTVIPSDPKTEVRVSFTIGLKCVRYGSESIIQVDIDTRFEKSSLGEYSKSYVLSGMNIVNDMAEFTVAAGEPEIKIGSELCSSDEDIVLRSVMTSANPAGSACDSLRTSLFNYVSNGSEIDICLAKISFENYAITKIKEFPFGQFYMTNAELAIENAALRDRICVLESLSSGNSESGIGVNANDSGSADIASGEAVIDLGVGGKAGKRFFSEEISHGLGLGSVQVTVGLKDESSDDDCFVYGSQEIFDERSEGIKAELAVRVNNDTGTFRIGLRLLEAAAEYNAVVHWTAVRRRAENGGEAADRRIVIDSGAKTLGIKESAYFTVKFVNLPPSDIRWSVLTENGGSIDDNGCYTAPNHSGVFKIRAVYVNDTSVTAAAYIVVKP